MNRTTIFAFIGVILASFAYADLCTIRGQIHYSSGEPIEKNTPISLQYDYYNFSYTDYAGDVWPYPNYYLFIFTCRQGEDSVTISALGEKTIVELDRGVIDLDITLTFSKEESPPVSSPDPSPKAKPSGSIVLPTSNQSMIEGNELVLHYNADWIDLSRYIFKIEKVRDSFVRIIIYPGAREIILYLGEKNPIDLDNDGEEDILIAIDKIEGKIAFASVERILKIPKEKELPRIAERQAPAAPPDEVTLDTLFSNAQLWINLVLILLIATLIIMLLRKKRHEN